MTEQMLINTAATLARISPQAWEMFVQALAAQMVEAGEALVSSEQTSLQLNQGRAQAYRRLYVTCRDAVTKQREIEGRK